MSSSLNASLDLLVSTEGLGLPISEPSGPGPVVFTHGPGRSTTYVLATFTDTVTGTAADGAPFVTTFIFTTSIARVSPEYRSSTSHVKVSQSRNSTIPAPSPSAHYLHDNGLPSGAVAGITVGAATVLLVILLLGFYLIRRRRRRGKLSSTNVARAGSTGYKKAELEGTILKNTISKAELPVGEKVIRATVDSMPLEEPVAAGTAPPNAAYQELEAVSIQGQQLSYHQLHQSLSGQSGLEEVGSPLAESSQSGAATEETVLLRRNNEDTSSSKDTAGTEPTPQDQAVVDASQLNKLKAEERELAEYIESHETLQKLKNEHVELQKRIKAAEQRAQRSEAIGRD